MDLSLKKQLQQVANTIRGLSMDAIEAANSGHPGLPLGCAEIAAYLFGKCMRYNPADPNWVNRDRFVLSAGHGSMLLYSALHLAGFEISIEDIKNFRQLHSACPGHPELEMTPGVEATTGPLGQGMGMGAGMALANQLINSALNLNTPTILDAYIYVLLGDGCMVEGVTNEVGSLAGHLKLDHLVVIYDSNDICLDGPTSENMSENVEARFKALGWQTVQIDGHSFDELESAFELAHQSNGKPTLIIAKTTIGKGSPNLQGKSDIHGKPMGADEVRLTKETIGIPIEPLFYVDPQVKTYFESHCTQLEAHYQDWQKRLQAWLQTNSQNKERWDQYSQKKFPTQLKENLKQLDTTPSKATRSISQEVIQFLYEHVPFLYGGSADLSCSDSTYMKQSGVVQSCQYHHRNIKYGAREFAMGTIANGMALQGMIIPFCGTFFVFSDYMRAAVRLASIMNLQVIYQWTHDSFYVGEDGATHHPIEQLASLRAMPNLTLFRPADSVEVKAAWAFALGHQGPTGIVLTRQKIKPLTSTVFELAQNGGYILVKEDKSTIDFCILASGSEVKLAVDVAAALVNQGLSVRVVSMPSFERFHAQPKSYQNKVLPRSAKQYCAIEAGVSLGWHQYVGRDGIIIALDRFSLSAKAGDLAETFGFTVDKIVKRLLHK